VRTFSNRYHFDGATPSGSTPWTTLADAVTAAEKAIYLPFATPGARITAAYGYAAGSEVPVFSKTYTLDGTLSATGKTPATGDSAALIRYSTSSRSSKNHPIYLFNYYHTPGSNAPSSQPDNLHSGQITAYNTYAAAWIAGFSDGTNTHHRCGPDGDLATGYLTQTLITHRDLPRG